MVNQTHNHKATIANNTHKMILICVGLAVLKKYWPQLLSKLTGEIRTAALIGAEAGNRLSGSLIKDNMLFNGFQLLSTERGAQLIEYVLDDGGTLDDLEEGIAALGSIWLALRNQHRF